MLACARMYGRAWALARFGVWRLARLAYEVACVLGCARYTVHTRAFHPQTHTPVSFLMFPCVLLFYPGFPLSNRLPEVPFLNRPYNTARPQIALQQQMFAAARAQSMTTSEVAASMTASYDRMAMAAAAAAAAAGGGGGAGGAAGQAPGIAPGLAAPMPPLQGQVPLPDAAPPAEQ